MRLAILMLMSMAFAGCPAQPDPPPPGPQPGPALPEHRGAPALMLDVPDRWARGVLPVSCRVTGHPADGAVTLLLLVGGRPVGPPIPCPFDETGTARAALRVPRGATQLAVRAELPGVVGDPLVVVEAVPVGPVVTPFSRPDPQLASLIDLTTDGVTGFYVTGYKVGGSGPYPNGILHLPMDGGPFSEVGPAFNPVSITNDGRYLYWIDPNAGPGWTVIFRQRIGGTEQLKIYSATDPIQDGGGIEFDPASNRLVTADMVGGWVHTMTPTHPVADLQLLARGYERTMALENLNLITVAAGVAYVATSGRSGSPEMPAEWSVPPRVWSVPLEGSAPPTTLYTGSLPSFSPQGIAVHGGLVCVSSGRQVLSLPIGGGAPKLLVADQRFGRLAGLLFFEGDLYLTDRGGEDRLPRVWKVVLPAGP